MTISKIAIALACCTAFAPALAQQQPRFQIKISVRVESSDTIMKNRLQSLLNHDFRKLDGVVLVDSNTELQVVVVFVAMRSTQGEDMAGMASILVSEPLSTEWILECVAREKDLKYKT